MDKVPINRLDVVKEEFIVSFQRPKMTGTFKMQSNHALVEKQGIEALRRRKQLIE